MLNLEGHIETNQLKMTIVNTAFITNKSCIYYECYKCTEKDIDMVFYRDLHATGKYFEPKCLKRYHADVETLLYWETKKKKGNTIHIYSFFYRNHLNKKYIFYVGFADEQSFHKYTMDSNTLFNYYTTQMNHEFYYNESLLNKSSIQLPPAWIVKSLCAMICDKIAYFDMERVKKDLFNLNAL